MDYVRLGGSGLEVSKLCLGTWMFGTENEDGVVATDREQAHELLDAAFERGINFFDTANNYGGGDSERYLGEWLEDRDRENVVVASKVYWTTRGRREAGLSRKIVRAEIEGTLERLGTDYLDVYYVHGWHEPSPLVETVSALNDLVRDGKVHYLGVSNFAAWQLLKALWAADTHDWEPVSVIQPRYNAADRVPYTVDPTEQPLPDLFDACRDQNVAVCPYAPLAGGFLTGKYDRGPDGAVLGPDGSRADLSEEFGPFSESEWAVLDAVREVAAELDASPAQVAIRWTMAVDGVTSVPIVGARSRDQLEENLGALDLSLSTDQHDRISSAGEGDDTSSWPVYGD
jgi:aryl-alcohol dehydrogenase-like predicted oxidoreductase